jgi:hypothetical protein
MVLLSSIRRRLYLKFLVFIVFFPDHLRHHLPHVDPLEVLGLDSDQIARWNRHDELYKEHLFSSTFVLGRPFP